MFSFGDWFGGAPFLYRFFSFLSSYIVILSPRVPGGGGPRSRGHDLLAVRVGPGAGAWFGVLNSFSTSVSPTGARTEARLGGRGPKSQGSRKRKRPGGTSPAESGDRGSPRVKIPRKAGASLTGRSSNVSIIKEKRQKLKRAHVPVSVKPRADPSGRLNPVEVVDTQVVAKDRRQKIQKQAWMKGAELSDLQTMIINAGIRPDSVAEPVEAEKGNFWQKRANQANGEPSPGNFVICDTIRECPKTSQTIDEQAWDVVQAKRPPEPGTKFNFKSKANQKAQKRERAKLIEQATQNDSRRIALQAIVAGEFKPLDHLPMNVRDEGRPLWEHKVIADCGMIAYKAAMAQIAIGRGFNTPERLGIAVEFTNRMLEMEGVSITGNPTCLQKRPKKQTLLVLKEAIKVGKKIGEKINTRFEKLRQKPGGSLLGPLEYLVFSKRCFSVGPVGGGDFLRCRSANPTVLLSL